MIQITNNKKLNSCFFRYYEKNGEFKKNNTTQTQHNTIQSVKAKKK